MQPQGCSLSLASYVLGGDSVLGVLRPLEWPGLLGQSGGWRCAGDGDFGGLRFPRVGQEIAR